MMKSFFFMPVPFLSAVWDTRSSHPIFYSLNCILQVQNFYLYIFRGNFAGHAVFWGNQLYITRFKFNEG